MNCPHCKKELTGAQVVKLHASWRGSITSAKKRKASVLNGLKGGRPKLEKGAK